MAKCGGITNAELNKLEVDLCELLRWNLAVQPDELIALTSQLQGDVSPDDDSSALLDSPVEVKPHLRSYPIKIIPKMKKKKLRRGQKMPKKRNNTLSRCACA